MYLHESTLWTSDLDEIIEAFPGISALAERRVLITGCTGLICSALTDLLVRWNELHKEKITILAAGRSIQRVQARFYSCFDRDWFKFVPFDAAAEQQNIDTVCDYIIHGASNAYPASIVREPVETMLSNVNGLKALLECAKRQSAKRVLFISSSEVYGRKEGTAPYRPDEYGYIDLLNARNSYSVGKRAAETLCAAYAAEYGVDSVIVRPGHIYGPTASEGDNRVSSAWAYDVARGKDIVMKSDGAQIRSYCYCLDTASAILKVLLHGKSTCAYNISNPDSILNIREMAEILTRTAGVQLKMELPTEEERKGFNPMSNSSLDSADLLALGWKGLFNAERGFSHTVQIIKELDDLQEG